MDFNGDNFIQPSEFDKENMILDYFIGMSIWYAIKAKILIIKLSRNKEKSENSMTNDRIFTNFL